MITVVILTKNEENNIRNCINSLLWCDEIIIIDDYSTDATLLEISNLKSQNLKIKIFKRKLNNDFAIQRNFGLSKAKGEWILFIDADEIVSKLLKREILSKI